MMAEGWEWGPALGDGDVTPGGPPERAGQPEETLMTELSELVQKVVKSSSWWERHGVDISILACSFLLLPAGNRAQSPPNHGQGSPQGSHCLLVTALCWEPVGTYWGCSKATVTPSARDLVHSDPTAGDNDTRGTAWGVGTVVSGVQPGLRGWCPGRCTQGRMGGDVSHHGTGKPWWFWWQWPWLWWVQGKTVGHGSLAGKLGPSLAFELLGMLKSWQGHDSRGIPHPRAVGWDWAPAAPIAIKAGSGQTFSTRVSVTGPVMRAMRRQTLTSVV